MATLVILFPNGIRHPDSRTPTAQQQPTGDATASPTRGLIVLKVLFAVGIVLNDYWELETQSSSGIGERSVRIFRARPSCPCSWRVLTWFGDHLP
jgi:hypothetical protein